MSICFFTVPASANQAAHMKVRPRQKSNIYVHIQNTRHNKIETRRQCIQGLKSRLT